MIAATRANGKTAHVISVEFADWLNLDVELIGLELGVLKWARTGDNLLCLGLGGAKPSKVSVRWPFMVSLLKGQYLASFTYVRLGQVDKFPALKADS